MKILIIEDEAEIRSTLQELLELNGHTVAVAVDGPEGIKAAQLLPDLILCDVGLPGLNGYEVLGALRLLPSCRDIPFIFLTARADRSDQRLGMALGADDYITKPFTEREIMDAINARVSRLRPLRERVEQLLGEHRTTVGANWSHELMTPLNAVLGGLEMIEEEADNIKPGELRELLRLIRVGAERQQVLSRKLVYHYELERLKATPAAARPARCCAAAALAAGAARAGPADQRAGDLTVRGEPAEVPLSEDQLSTAITELVGNAIRFSSPGQPVTATGSRAGRRYTIVIVDQGPGMTAKQTGAIGAFVQFGRDKREQQGLGLGLAIARSVAELAGGKLTFEPGPGDRGLKVTMDLPCG
jgi:two-component system, sensor histidine kinase and response regulator